MVLLQIDMNEANYLNAVADVLGWIPKVMELFLQPPAIYFISFAIVMAAAGVARKFVPMRKR